MPDVLTHVLFGYDMIDYLDKSKYRDLINKNKKLFILGCQGPDIFFYNDFWPWIKGKRGPSLGKLMHREKTGEYFIKSLEYIKQKSGEGCFGELFSYITGAMCHFGLDRVVHPYIFYYSGKYNKNDVKTHKYREYHKKLELIIDALLLKEKKDLLSHKYPVYKEIDLGKELPKSIRKFYKHIIKSVYNLDIKSDFSNDAYKDMKRVLKVMYDPLGFKKILLNSIDFIKRGRIKYSNLTYPRKFINDKDYLNESNKIWLHPCDETKSYNASFHQLYNRAKDESENMIDNGIKFLNNKLTKKELKEAFPNLSYSTGEEINNNIVMKYFDPIFD